ncbi:hypothetical protein Cfor_01526 [Coptotermes formosanus]|uniref:Reverse transcriptase domain-containing protein n=1 Tax=Coptotermes formosanus TaxID=36987 RepID=A0A6L2PT88_COPFO|nr:hypothetical protein Cfor_01526 [Coptotermes formosanus]
MRDLIKIHKDNVTIRPTVNWKESPAYKLLKFMVKTLQSYITLPYAFNPTNTHTLTKDLKEIKCEIGLPHREHTKIIYILNKHKIIGYFKDVDDILIIYNSDQTDIQKILHTVNNLTTHLKFTIEEEKNNVFNFLDITIKKMNNQFHIGIYRKPTTTDCIIPYNSWHSYHHETSAERYFPHRIATYPLSKAARTTEINTRKQTIKRGESNARSHNGCSTRRRHNTLHMRSNNNNSNNSSSSNNNNNNNTTSIL